MAKLLLVCMAFLGPSHAWAGDDDAIAQAKKELLPRPVHLQSKAMPLSQALAELEKQTGNKVVDRRRTKTDLPLKLDLGKSTFWPALEVIAKTAGCGISTYQGDGQVALVDGLVRPVSTVFQGIFRLRATRLAVAKDDDAGTHAATVALEVAWEPRFKPLYLDLGSMQAIFAADDKGIQHQAKADGQGKISVAGRNAAEVNIHLSAPSRSSAKIVSLEGQFKVMGPAKMLTFAFPKLQAASKSDCGVEVSLKNVKTASRRWSVQMEIDNSEGNPVLESFQSWLGNNRISLEKGEGPGRAVWLPQTGDERVERETAKQATIVYSFPISKVNPGSIGDWTLIYRTPGRIVEIEVSFTFKDLPLP